MKQIFLYLSFIYFLIFFSGNEEYKISEIKKINNYENIEEMNKLIKIYTLFNVIKKYEKFENKAYKLGGKFYIGYGHLIRKKEKYLLYKTIDSLYAEQLFINDFMEKYNYFSRYGMEEKYKLLLSALAYNIGEGKVRLGRIFYYAMIDNEKYFVIYYLKYSKFQGKHHKGIYKRRIQELEAIFGYKYRYLY